MDNVEKISSETHTHTAEALNLIKLALANLKDLNSMVESKSPCTEVVSRLSAIIQVLIKCRGVLIGDHINGCVGSVLKPGQEQVLREVNKLIHHLTSNPTEGSHH